MNSQFSENDLQQIASMGLTPEKVLQQIENFRKGFPKSKLLDAATVDNGGIIRMSDDDIRRYSTAYKKLASGKKILKFVPASGAATRMFKDLYAFSSTYFGVAYNFEKEFPTVNTKGWLILNPVKNCYHIIMTMIIV